MVRAISSTASVTRDSKRVSSVVERALDHVDVDGDVGGPQGPGADAQALADRRQRVVGLGDDADDLGVVLLELTHVDDAVGDEDPSRVVDGGCGAHVHSPDCRGGVSVTAAASIRQGCDINVRP